MPRRGIGEFSADNECRDGLGVCFNSADGSVVNRV
jgi:hypothetical protein